MRANIEVGTSIGDDFINLVQDTEVDIVIGFEPVPSHASYTNARATEVAKVQFKVYQAAVDIESGEKTFHLANPEIWCNGAGSLLETSDNIGTTWPDRDDLIQKETLKVPCLRLDEVIEANQITSIKFADIDAQGKDLDVLRSLGKYISILESGRVEVPSSPDVALYKNQHQKEEMLKFLEDNGFEWRITDDGLQNEENVYFKKK